jgi:hypothetical protein
LIDLGGQSDHDRSGSFAGRNLGEVDGVTVAVVGDEDVAVDRKDLVWCWHLHNEVGVMGYSAELGQHGSTMDGMVGRAEVRDLECQIFRAEVALCDEGDRQAYMTYGVCSLAGYNTIEGFIIGSHLGEDKVHLSQRFCEDDVQIAAPVDEGLRQERALHYGVDDQRVGPGVWYVYLMVFPGESDGVLRPTQRLQSFCVDLVDLPCLIAAVCCFLLLDGCQ